MLWAKALKRRGSNSWEGRDDNSLTFTLLNLHWTCCSESITELPSCLAGFIFTSPLLPAWTPARAGFWLPPTTATHLAPALLLCFPRIWRGLLIHLYCLKCYPSIEGHLFFYSLTSLHSNSWDLISLEKTDPLLRCLHLLLSVK